jgi:uncharacterized membrane protein YtjA (UPF0391 family)
MLPYAVIFLIVASFAALFGLSAMAIGLVEITEFLLFVFLILWLINSVWEIHADD